MLVKRRWDIIMVCFIIASILVGLSQTDNLAGIIGFLFITGDCVIVGVIMSLLGLKWKQVHNYSLCVLIFVHGVFACI